MHPQEPLYANERANIAELKRRFPTQFEDHHRFPGGWHSWPDGWHHLVEGVCQAAYRQGLAVRWAQIKEKFGTLRMYPVGGAARIDLISEAGHASLKPKPDSSPLRSLIDQAEAESRATCMRCGQAGARRNIEGFLVTLCDGDYGRYLADLKSYRSEHEDVDEADS